MKQLYKRGCACDSTFSNGESQKRILLRLLAMIASILFSILLHYTHTMYVSNECLSVSDKQFTKWLLGMTMLGSSFLQKSGNYISIDGTVLSDFTNEYFYSSQYFIFRVVRSRILVLLSDYTLREINKKTLFIDSADEEDYSESDISEFARHPLNTNSRDSYSDVYLNIYKRERETLPNPPFLQEYTLELYSGSSKCDSSNSSTMPSGNGDHFEITLVSQTTFFSCSFMMLRIDRLFFIPHFLSRWNGSSSFHLLMDRPISITVFVDKSALYAARSFIVTSSLPSRLMLTLYIPVNRDGDCIYVRHSSGDLSCTRQLIYPINRLRNLAIRRVETSHFIMLDMDAWPSCSSFSSSSTLVSTFDVLMKLPKQYLANPYFVTILPTFSFSSSYVNTNQLKTLQESVSM